MTKIDLLKKLEKMSDDKVIILKDGKGGWCNIENIVENNSTISILMETNPLFSDN